MTGKGAVPDRGLKPSTDSNQPEAGTRFWPQILCFRGKIRSFYLFEGMGSFSRFRTNLAVNAVPAP